MKKNADTILEEMLENKPVRDPRIICREQLQKLREIDRRAYQKALNYYEETLLSEITGGKENCLSSWENYACFVANLCDPGIVVEIDTDGNQLNREDPTFADRMLLHMPEVTSRRAIAVTLPLELSVAQDATYQLLVKGSHQLKGGK